MDRWPAFISLCYIVAMLTATSPHSIDSTERPNLASVADRVGATASLLCAVHCAALPLVLALLPALGLGFLANHGFERAFIFGASVLSMTMAIHGYRRHRMTQAFALLLPGLCLLWVGGFLFDGAYAHALLVAAGGACVALAHATNLRLARVERACACSTPA
jgi:hypothetical protein